MLADPELFEELVSNPLTSSARTDEQVAHVVAKNVAIKRDVVNADETETKLKLVRDDGTDEGRVRQAV